MNRAPIFIYFSSKLSKINQDYQNVNSFKWMNLVNSVDLISI